MTLVHDSFRWKVGGTRILKSKPASKGEIIKIWLFPSRRLECKNWIVLFTRDVTRVHHMVYIPPKTEFLWILLQLIEMITYLALYIIGLNFCTLNVFNPLLCGKIIDENLEILRNCGMYTYCDACLLILFTLQISSINTFLFWYNSPWTIWKFVAKSSPKLCFDS